MNHTHECIFLFILKLIHWLYDYETHTNYILTIYVWNIHIILMFLATWVSSLQRKQHWVQHALNILFISTNNVFLCVMISYYTYSQNSAACSDLPRGEKAKDRREHHGIKVQYVLRGLCICQTSEKCWHQEKKCWRYFCCYFGLSHIRRSRRTPGCLLHVCVWCQKDCRFSSASGRQSPPLQKAGKGSTDSKSIIKNCRWRELFWPFAHIRASLKYES